MKNVSVLYFYYRREYFHETLYKYKPPSDDIRRKITVTPSTFFTELCPFENAHVKIVSALQLKTVRDIFMKLGTKINKLVSDNCRAQEM